MKFLHYLTPNYAFFPHEIGTLSTVLNGLTVAILGHDGVAERQQLEESMTVRIARPHLIQYLYIYLTKAEFSHRTFKFNDIRIVVEHLT